SRPLQVSEPGDGTNNRREQPQMRGATSDGYFGIRARSNAADGARSRLFVTSRAGLEDQRDLEVSRGRLAVVLGSAEAPAHGLGLDARVDLGVEAVDVGAGDPAGGPDGEADGDA